MWKWFWLISFSLWVVFWVAHIIAERNIDNGLTACALASYAIYRIEAHDGK